ncbi:MAG TPA: polynucleotide kinase-phosphatase [Tepidisphaeraceae bacterium]|jgi:polynucleotide kinase-phosphatase|nr:polynucleotide kinase-phosphatase [Tepidisphaeraceae bacterium]
MKLTIPELSLVALIGPSGCGKSTFARKHFKPTEVLSSDFCRGLVSDDENSQHATGDAFDVLRYIAAKRLARGLLTVIDATNVQPESRKALVDLAREHDVLPVAIVLDVPEKVCHERNRARPDRDFGAHVIRNQIMQMRRSLRHLDREGFRYVHRLGLDDSLRGSDCLIDEVLGIERKPLWNNRKWDNGPFDIIGDVHGCFDELSELLTNIGFTIGVAAEGPADEFGISVTPPAGRKAVFVGDLVDRGPKVVEVLKFVMAMAKQGVALCVPGNHDVKLMRKLQGRNVQITHGLAETLEQMEKQPPAFAKQVEQFIDKLVSHYVLNEGRLVVAHAGMKEQYVGRASGRVREFALYGETTGETDEFGLPIRYNWAAEYRGGGHVVYGHTPVPDADWLNRTMNIDTGCVFGGKLTALRWPEKEVISVPARRAYAEPKRPFLVADPAAASPLSAQQQYDDVLDLSDVTGKRIVATRLHHSVTIREENATAALEVMSRFAANPKWLIYLPPTMSPTETSDRPGLLEHPQQAFDYFRNQGVGKVVCQEKHMGSRAVTIICGDECTAQRRFGIAGDGRGIIFTRTGRRFFNDRAVEEALLGILHDSLTAAGFWELFSSDWFCLDCELMPWSAKAQDLLKTQYAAVGSAARASVSASVNVLQQAAARYAAIGSNDLNVILDRQRERLTRVNQYVDAYRQYCWPVNSVNDLKLAPFHLLASEGAVHVDKDHLWHMQTLGRLADAIPGTPLLATTHRVVDVTDVADIDGGIAWWETLTGSGGEGMVVKPLEFVVRAKKGLVQPAVKCRGPEYLRIIYGPEYDAPENLQRLRSRGLAAKRSLALREFALGIEGLERFVRREPLRRVHECVFGVLALESEPVDPRL